VTAGDFPLDATSAGIIEALQRDGRRSYASIGKQVGMSEAAVRQRVQRMVEAGVFEIVAVTDPLQLGFARSAMVGIRVEGPLDPVAEALTAIDEVTYLVLTAGMWDLLAEVVCEDDEHLLRVVSEQIRGIDQVTGTETMVYLQIHKQTYDEGVRLPG
jgi:Lrp/AsnC family transcriptional regulator, regulator for asnA, asnC and gidA